MNKIIFSFISAASILVVSCNNDATTKASTTTLPAQNSNVQLPPSTNNANPVVPVSNATTGSSAPNPEHGKPGHRCDIPVGAPLNSAGTQPVTQPVAQPVPQQATQSQPQAIVGNPKQVNTSPATAGINPAHGQPGHRCDIAVGAPLNSAPAATNAAPQTVTTTTSAPAQPSSLQFNPSQASSSAPVGKGLNPAHGQPGHRCDLAVGAPLDSKPKQ